METRLDKLEKRVASLEKAILDSPSIPIEQKSQKEVHAKKHVPGWFDALLAWIKEDFLMKLGAFLLLLGLGWFVSYAFTQGWVGPVGRISLGVAAGTLILGWGYSIMEKRRSPGQVLTVLGGTMILLTLYAAREYYGFFTAEIVAGMMSLVVVLMAVIAIKFNARNVAYSALIGGSLVPILASSGSSNHLGMLSFIFLLDLGVLAVVSKRGWRGLLLLAFVVTVGYSDSMNLISDGQTWTFMALFFGLFFLSNLMAMLRTKEVRQTDLTIQGLNGLLLLFWIVEYVPEEWQSLVMAAVTILMALVTYMMLATSGLRKPMYVNGALAAVFLAAALAVELSGAVLIIAYFIETYFLVHLTSLVLKEKTTATFVSLTQAVPILMAFDLSFSKRLWIDVPLFNEHFFVLAVGLASLWGTAYILRKFRLGEKLGVIYALQLTAAALFGGTLIWLSAHNLMDPDVARTVALTIYALIGVGLFYFGEAKDEIALRMGGGAILGLVVLRLLFFEVWEMDLLYRVITFFAIGALLVATAFFNRGKK